MGPPQPGRPLTIFAGSMTLLDVDCLKGKFQPLGPGIDQMGIGRNW